MDATHLYQQIVEAIRQDIFAGTLKPGSRLPAMRKMTALWKCNTGTIQRAYQELARQGLVVSRVGQGTRVAEQLPEQKHSALGRAVLLNRTEAFLLDILTAGYSPDEVEQALRLALDRWRTVSKQPDQRPGDVLRFAGSHDPAMALVAAHYQELSEGFRLQLSFTGSLGGLIALAEKRAEIAGCHLWDEKSDSYNEPFVRKLLPGQQMVQLTLAQRRIGLITAAGNPLGVHDLADLARQGIRFANRQQGSGTRVWLNAQLQRQGIDPASITGFQDEKMTHSEVARAILKGQADAGLGVETAALVFGLDFQLLNTERYDLIIPAEIWQLEAVQTLKRWLATAQAKAAISNLGGYDTSQTGMVNWIS